MLLMIDDYSIYARLPDHLAMQHCPNIGRKFSVLSLRSQKDIFFSPLLIRRQLLWEPKRVITLNMKYI